MSEQAGFGRRRYRLHGSTLGVLAVGAAVVLALVSAPPPAFATFTGTEQLSTAVTTGLPAPATADVTMECNQVLLGLIGWDNVVTVNAYAKVPRATSYEILIFDGDELKAQGDTTSRLTIWTPSKPGTGWRYELRAKYAVPGSPSNVWTGRSLHGPLSCAS